MCLISICRRLTRGGTRGWGWREGLTTSYLEEASTYKMPYSVSELDGFLFSGRTTQRKGDMRF